MTETEELYTESDSPELQRVIQQVKSELKEQNRRMLITRKEVVIRLGKAFEREVSDPEWICEEIKNELKNEIVLKLISHRDIERYCLPTWKKKTKPKKERENDNMSFSKEKKQPVMITTTDGRAILEDQDNSETDERNPAIVDTRCEEVDLDDAQLSDIENSDQNKSTLSGDDYMEFEFSLPFDKLHKYMEDEFKIHNGTEPVWIHGTLNKLTGKIIGSYLGRIPNRH